MRIGHLSYRGQTPGDNWIPGGLGCRPSKCPASTPLQVLGVIFWTIPLIVHLDTILHCWPRPAWSFSSPQRQQQCVLGLHQSHFMSSRIACINGSGNAWALLGGGRPPRKQFQGPSQLSSHTKQGIMPIKLHIRRYHGYQFTYQRVFKQSLQILHLGYLARLYYHIWLKRCHWLSKQFRVSVSIRLC